jgi:hypothetical protein
MSGSGSLHAGNRREKGGTPTPCGGRCMPYNDRVIGQHVSGVLAVGPAFDDAAHPSRLACATGRVSFSEGGPQLSCGSPLLAIHPFGPSEWRPSLGFTASGLTWDLSSGYFMSDNAGQMCCHRPVGRFSEVRRVSSFPAESVAPTRQTSRLHPKQAVRKAQNDS